MHALLSSSQSMSTSSAVRKTSTVSDRWRKEKETRKFNSFSLSGSGGVNMGWRGSLLDLTLHRKVDYICGFGTAGAQSATMARLWRSGCSFPWHWDEATSNEVKLAK